VPNFIVNSAAGAEGARTMSASAVAAPVIVEYHARLLPVLVMKSSLRPAFLRCHALIIQPNKVAASLPMAAQD
jgi:hypothetical protein